jgi:membrane protein DedA with SNARE-associated domain
MQDIIYSILNWFADLGYFGILLGLMVEVIPSEIVFAYGGFLVTTGNITFVGAVIAGTIGALIAQMFLYWIGYYGGRPFLLKYGKYLHIKEKHLDLAESWFKRYGDGVVFGARFVPVMRQVISIPAGIAKMSAIRFMVLTVLATVPWAMFFLYLGMKLGSNWKNIEEAAGPYLHTIAFSALGLLILYFGIQWLIKRRRNKTITR